MVKTNINAIVQTIECSLHSMYKHRFSIEQQQFFSDFCIVSVVYECNICPPERLCIFFQVQNGIKTLKIFYQFIRF